MPCSEYETLMRRFRYQYALKSSFEAVNRNDHCLSVSRAQALSREVHATAMQLLHAMHRHKMTCDVCKHGFGSRGRIRMSS
jgi:hypothetical protein